MANIKASHLHPRTHMLIALISLVVLYICTAVAARQSFNGLELSVFRLIYDLPDSLRWIFLIITQLGSAWMVLILFATALSAHVKNLAYKIFLNGSVTYIAVEYLKLAVARPRPAAFYSWITPREDFAAGNGFPSGHTAMATVLAFTLMPYTPKRFRWLLILAVALVGVSRIYLGVHAPLDVIGGAALGLIVASFQHIWSTTKDQRKVLKKQN